MSLQLKIVAVLGSLAILISQISNLNSARADYQTAYRDYVYNYSVYKNAHNDYQIAKSSYQTYHTLTSQNEAVARFKTVLKARDNVISAYYDLLQEKLSSTEGISPDTKSTFGTISQSEKAYLTSHQKRVDDASTLSDLNAVSQEFESRYGQISLETKQAIGNVLLTKEANLKIRLDALVSDLTRKTEEIRQSGEDTGILDRGLIAANNKLDFYEKQYAAAKLTFSGVKQDRFSQTVPTINVFAGQQSLAQANQYLRETMTILKEAVRSITGGQI